MAFGTFDIFHEGHRSYLEQAKELGDYLIVVLARDETVIHVKKQGARNKEQARLKNLKDAKIADEVVLGSLEDRYAVIEKFRPDIIALGYDQRVDEVELTEKLENLKLKAEVVRLKSFAPERFKSSKLRN